MKKIICLVLITLSSVSQGRIYTRAGKEGVVTTFDYNGKSYRQTLSIETLEQTREFRPLEGSIDIKAIANAAIQKANEINPDKAYIINGVSLTRANGKNGLWYVSVGVGEAERQIVWSQLSFLFSVSGASAEVVEEVK